MGGSRHDVTRSTGFPSWLAVASCLKLLRLKGNKNMADINSKPKKRLTRGRPATKTPYQQAAEYERAQGEFDRREAKIKADREQLDAETPAAVRQMVALSMKAKKTEPAPVTSPSEPTVVPVEPARPKPTGKPNGAHVAQA